MKHRITRRWFRLVRRACSGLSAKSSKNYCWLILGSVYHVMRAIIRTVHEIQRRISMHSVELANYIYKQHGRY